MERNPRADAVIAQFTDDPELIEQIYGHMADFQAGKTSLQQIIAQYTSDPVLTERILTNVSKTQTGFKPMTLALYETPDTTLAENAAETINKHKGVVEYIVVEH